MKKFQLAITAALFGMLIWASGCTPKEGTCECTKVYSDSTPTENYTIIRPNANPDCSFEEGREWYGNYYADITCTMID